MSILMLVLSQDNQKLCLPAFISVCLMIVIRQSHLVSIEDCLTLLSTYLSHCFTRKGYVSCSVKHIAMSLSVLILASVCQDSSSAVDEAERPHLWACGVAKRAWGRPATDPKNIFDLKAEKMHALLALRQRQRQPEPRQSGQCRILMSSSRLLSDH